MSDDKLPFSSEYVNTAKVQKGLKLKSKSDPKKSDVPDRVEFEKAADQLIEYKQRRNKEIINLVKQFFDLLKDKTLLQNKKGLALEVEQEHRNRFIKLVTEIDLDETESEGMGTYAALNTFLKAMLIQRDIINELSYTVHLLEKRLKDLEVSEAPINEQ